MLVDQHMNVLSKLFANYNVYTKLLYLVFYTTRIKGSKPDHCLAWNCYISFKVKMLKPAVSAHNHKETSLTYEIK